MLLKLALRNLLRNRRRTAAILLTVAAGAGSLFIFQGFNNGVMNQYRDNTVHSRYGHGQLNVKHYRDRVLERPWEQWITQPDDLRRRLEQLPQVAHVFPRVHFYGLLTNGRVTVAGQGQGVDGREEAQFFDTLNVTEGVTLSDQPDGILLGRGLARSLDVGPGDRVTVLANTIHGTMNGVDLTVTGVFHTGSKDFDDTVFRLPLRHAQTLLDTDRVEVMSIGLRRLEDWDEFSRVVGSSFAHLEAVPFAVLDEVYYQHSVDWLDSQFGIIRAIILFVVILGIFNTVSTAVLERKQEIGNLRANGESFFEVLQLLILEGVALGVLGAALGVVVAFAVDATALRNGFLMPPAPGITRQFQVLLEFEPAMALKAFGLGAAAATVGTVFAGLRVARMPIGEALRSV